MKLRNLVAPVLFGAFGLSTGAHAVPADNNATDGGRIITNNATLDYKVNGQSQAQVDAFENVLVDVKIDFDLTRGALNSSTTVYDLPGASTGNRYYLVGQVKLANTGNTPTSFTLSAIDAPITTDVNGDDTGGVSTKNLTSGNFKIFLETGTTTGLSADDTEYTSSVNIDKNGNQDIYIVALQNQASLVDNDILGTRLAVKATSVTRQLATIGANNAITYTPSPVNVPANSNDSVGDLAFVFADTDNNAEEVIFDGMLASFPDLNNGGNAGDGNGNFTKTATVISDPFNGVSSDAKAIPGAIVEYVIKVSNTGSSDATDVIVSDPIPADTTYVASSLRILESDSSTPPAPTATAVTGATQVSGSDPTVEIEVDLGTLEDGETNFIVYRVEIK